MKRSSIIGFTTVMLFGLQACSSDESPAPGPTITVADISVSTNVSTITYDDNTDLNQQLSAAITYNSASAPSSHVDNQLTFNADSSQVTASISFKAQFANLYTDPNTSNNSRSISLTKSPPPSGAVVLSADGPGDTYALITSVLAPGHNPIEVPDCGHGAFGEHIDEVFDNTLNQHVFRFILHVDEDNDRCINFDRQRNEIKSYNQSPANLLAVEGETVVYKWKLKLDAGFQGSSNFTHLHQLKSVNDAFDSMPMITFTARGSSNKMELRYAEFGTQTTIDSESLDLFRGNWVEVEENVTYSNPGSYSVEMKTLDGTSIFSYSNSNINVWRDGADFIRPKWGIYRSLNNAQDLRDEAVHFADFSIEEL